MLEKAICQSESQCLLGWQCQAEYPVARSLPLQCFLRHCSLRNIAAFEREVHRALGSMRGRRLHIRKAFGFLGCVPDFTVQRRQDDRRNDGDGLPSMQIGPQQVHPAFSVQHAQSNATEVPMAHPV